MSGKRKGFDPNTTLYLFCLDTPVGNPGKARGTAKHYLGSCKNGTLRHRLLRHLHLAKDGSKLIRAAIFQELSGTIYVLRNDGGAALEAYYKRRKKSFARICPRCSGEWKELNPYMRLTKPKPKSKE